MCCANNHLHSWFCHNSYGTWVNQYCESNRGQGKQKMVREKSGNFMRGNCWTPCNALSLVLLLLSCLAGKMSDVPESAANALAKLKTFDKCSHFRASFDTYDMCASCRAKEGRPECTREDNCVACVSWDDVIWDLYGKNIQHRQRAKQRKIEKTRTSSMSSEDSVSMLPEGEADFDEPARGGTSPSQVRGDSSQAPLTSTVGYRRWGFAEKTAGTGIQIL